MTFTTKVSWRHIPFHEIHNGLIVPQGTPKLVGEGEHTGVLQLFLLSPE